MTGSEPAGDLVLRTPALDELARLGTWLALSESGSNSEKAVGAAAALRLYYAAELGLPATAVAELSVINGRLFMSAQLLRAMAEREGYRIFRTDANGNTCTAVLFKDGKELGRATFTLDDAKNAGLANRGAWKTHPARMLWARASKNVIVDFAPGVALGIALDDEVQEYTGQTQPPTDDPDNDIPWPDVAIDEPVEDAVYEPAEQAVEAELGKYADPVEFEPPEN